MYLYLSYLSIATIASILAVNFPLQLQDVYPKMASALLQIQKNPTEKREAIQLSQRGRRQLSTGQLREALNTFQKVLALYRTIGTRADEAEALNNLGETYNDLSQYDHAVENLQQALFIHAQISNRRGEGETLSILGEVYNNLGQTAKALETLKQALAIHQEVRERAGEGKTLYRLGSVYISLSQNDQAAFRRHARSDRCTGDRLGRTNRAPDQGAWPVPAHGRLPQPPACPLRDQ